MGGHQLGVALERAAVDGGAALMLGSMAGQLVGGAEFAIARFAVEFAAARQQRVDAICGWRVMEGGGGRLGEAWRRFVVVVLESADVRAGYRRRSYFQLEYKCSIVHTSVSDVDYHLGAGTTVEQRLRVRLARDYHRRLERRTCAPDAWAESWHHAVRTSAAAER